jgi:hypothetical protein
MSNEVEWHLEYGELVPPQITVVPGQKVVWKNYGPDEPQFEVIWIQADCDGCPKKWPYFIGPWQLGIWSKTGYYADKTFDETYVGRTYRFINSENPNYVIGTLYVRAR